MGLAFSPSGLAELHYPLPGREPVLGGLAGALSGGHGPERSRLGAPERPVARLFRGAAVAFEVAAGPRAYTPFQRAVWGATLRIPYGGDQDLRLGRVGGGCAAAPTARVGAAMAANPIPIIIPCHRVLRSNGGLGGYGGGLALKQRLLAMEKGVAITAVQSSTD